MIWQLSWGSSLMISPLFKQSFLLSSSTVFRFSTQTWVDSNCRWPKTTMLLVDQWINELSCSWWIPTFMLSMFWQYPPTMTNLLLLLRPCLHQRAHPAGSTGAWSAQPTMHTGRWGQGFHPGKGGPSWAQECTRSKTRPTWYYKELLTAIAMQLDAARHRPKGCAPALTATWVSHRPFLSSLIVFAIKLPLFDGP